MDRNLVVRVACLRTPETPGLPVERGNGGGPAAAVHRRRGMVAPTRPGVPDGAWGMNRFAVWAMGSNTAAAKEAAAGHLVRSLDGMTVATTLFRFDDSYAREVPGLSVPWAAAPVPAPELAGAQRGAGDGAGR